MKRLLVLGSYGRGNVGDDVFVLALREALHGARLTINAADPAALPASISTKVEVIPTSIMANPVGLVRALLANQAVLYGGGDLWVELYGDRFPRQALYKMVLLNGLMRMLGKRVYYIGCGVGDLHGYSLKLARLSARLATAIIARDEQSARRLGRDDIRVLPDIAVTLPALQERRPARRQTDKKIIGIAPLYYVPEPAVNYPALLDSLAALIHSVPATTHRFVLLPMLRSKDDAYDDVRVCRELLERVGDADVTVYDAVDSSAFIDRIAGLDLVVGARLHANILAILSGVPALGISYRPKVANMFKSQHLTDYCVPIEAVADAGTVFRSMLADYDVVVARFSRARQAMLAQRAAYRQFFAAQFSEVER